ncbi:SGNH/GDSL hydrolase family protein [Candidatus Nitrospira inopinata]|uniref:SGNH/GDSL hydrolase family protein n=1 Tax=Candidatus Nitrospira inopinata TaxID=1715989 RepID=UPI0013010B7A|nr:SGNH/GDSL hydrolase family protein [Candidatus Nitrospira inopinata]
MFDEDLFYKPRPGPCEFKNVEFSTVLTFDEMGFRQSGLSDEKMRRPTSGRVVVLGDSQAMGWGVQDHETFAAVLAHEYGFAVFNLAVSSYGTARELLRLQKEFSLQPGDVVVIQYHPNDLPENLAFLMNSGRLPHRSPSDLARLKHAPQDYGVLQVTASIFFILKGKLIHAVSGSSKSERDGRHAETFLAVVDRFSFLNKARVLVCEVNSFGLATSFADELERSADGRIGVLKPVWEPEDFYKLDPHLTPTGHRHVARVIAAAIVTN